MVINYFAKLFYFKIDKFCIQKMNKKISKEAERQGIRQKAIRKNHINKKKATRLLYVKLVHVAQCTASHECNSHMYESALFKNGKKFPHFLYVFVNFFPFF